MILEQARAMHIAACEPYREPRIRGLAYPFGTPHGMPPHDGQRTACEGDRVTVVPITLREARQFVAAHHRHNEPPRGHKFSVGLANGVGLVGVVIAGRPVARGSDDGRTIELLRVTTTGDRNACSRLYGAACRAAAAMGYRKAITYTLADEPGTSLRAAGFAVDAELPEREAWAHTSGPRATEMPRLFDAPKMPTAAKVRWVRELAA